MAEASDLEDSALPPAAPPASAPAAIGQTETAPAPGPADAAPQDTQPRAQSTDDGFDDLFPADQRAKAESFEEIFRPEERAVQPPFMSLFSDNAEEAALSRDQWSIYLQNTRVGAAITAFGHAFTGPGMTEEFQKKYKEISDALEPAQGRTDSVAQVLMRPALRDLANFTAGFTAVPVALMDALARGIYGVAEGATELTKGTGAEKLVRDIAAKIIDMEMQWGGVVPGGKTMSAAMHAAERSGVEMLEAALKPEARVRPPAETAVEIKAEAWAKERLARLNEIPDDKIHPWDEVERRWLRTDPHGELLLQAYPPLRDIVSDNRLPEPIAAARAEAVIAEGEEGYMGTRAPTEADLVARREAAADLRTREPDTSLAAPLKAEEAPDIHTVARSIAPEVVDEWQQLQTRKTNLNRWLDELRETRDEKLESEPPPEVAALNEKIAALERKLETRKPGATTQRLTDLRAQRDAALARARSVGDNHDMAVVRADLVATDLRMRDMAAQISQIYREAEDLLPPSAAEAEIPATVAESRRVGAEPAPGAGEVPVGIQAAPGASPGAPAAAPAPVDYVQQFRDIAQKVNDALVAAGRNPEYAKADAEVMAARYVARSRAMQGVIGTPLEIFERDGLEFQGRAAAKAKEPEFAQDGTRRTDTPEFREWFAGSVLKNEDGSPVMLFHGTSDDIREFDLDHPNRKDSGWLGTGVYLTDDPGLASTYASLKSWDVTRPANADRNVMPMYASLKNPYYATLAEKQAMQGAGREAADAWTAELKAKGYDGVILEFPNRKANADGSPPGSREVVVFDRGDAKSVFNEGEWDRSNADVLHQKGRGGVRHAERGRSALDEGRKIVDLMRTADASTVMHEMGHTMLGDLARDAAHPQAPAQVKADWEATKKWLGIDDAAALQAKEKDKRGRMVLTKAARAANEKFARGTERYLMEGIAPSKALARVFEQFRQWLTSIYQTVTRLRVEMTPEMREVFDRLLSAEHDRVVIAPELPLKEGLADRHEGLVSSAKTRQEADALGDQVHRETAEEAQARARRVVNELRIRRGEQPLPEPEAGGRPAQRAGDDRGVAAAGPDAGGAAGVPGPRAEFPSRTVAAQDGGRPVIPDRPRALYARVPKRPTGLIEFLKARGGVQNHNGEVKALGIGRGLIKADGLKIDDAALSAWDAGYFPGMAERPTVREFLNALEDDAKGAGRFSEHDSEAVAAYEAARAHNSEVDQLATELGIEARGLTYGEFWDKVAERKSLEDLGKEVEDRLGAFESRMAEADRKAQEFLESRGDAWEPDHHGDGPARTLEDLENERRQEAAARGTLEGAADVGARGSAGADQAGVQAGGGFGGYRPGDPGGDVAPRAEGVRGEAGGGAVVAKPGPEAAAGGRPGTAPADAAELVPTAGQRFDNPLPDLIDKAGNVRLDNLNSTEAVNTVLRDFAEKNGLFMDARRGVVTDTEVLEFAEALGTDANIERLRAMSVEDGVPLAARIRAGRQMLIDSAQKVFEAMNGLDEMAYLEASQRHLRIQETLSGITAEWGRAGRAFRMMADEAKTAENLSEFLQSAIGRPLHEVQAEMVLGKKLKSPLQVSKFLRDARNPTMTGRVLEVWINALLSGPKTHMANVTGIALVSVMNVMETGVASGIGQMRHLVTGTQDRVFFGEAAEQLFALRQGTVEGLEAAWAILKDENTINSLGLIERPISGQIGGMLGEVVRAPSRALAAEDAVFKAIGYRQKINQLAYRAARLEGLEGDALARRVTALKDTPTAAMMKESADFARYQTFNKELGPIGQSTQRWIASHPSFKFIAPFVRTPANIFKYTIERSPLAFASLLQERLGPEVRANLRGENGAAMRDIQLARIALGSSLLVVGYMLAAEGVGTGSGPMNPGQRAAMFREGKRPNSFHLNGENVPFGRYEPLSTFLGWGADLYAIKHPATDKEAENWATAALVAVVSNITSKAALRGPAQFFAFLNNPNLTVKGYVSSQLGSMVPSVFAQGTEAADRFDRQSREWYDRILSRLPGGRQRLMPALDVWGRPIENEQHGVMGAVVPGMPSRLTEDPVEQELKRLQYFPSRVPDKILTTRLNDVQFFAYQRISGVIARQSIEAWMAHPGWSSIPAADRREILVDVVRDAREKARGYLIATSRNTDHDIAKQALSNKQALRAQMEERARLEAE